VAVSDEELTRLAAQVAVERDRVRALVALVHTLDRMTLELDAARVEIARLRAAVLALEGARA
jgi:hypothetical protein